MVAIPEELTNLLSGLNSGDNFKTVAYSPRLPGEKLCEALNAAGIDSSYSFVAVLPRDTPHESLLLFRRTAMSQAASLKDAANALQGLAEMMPMFDALENGHVAV